MAPQTSALRVFTLSQTAWHWVTTTLPSLRTFKNRTEASKEEKVTRREDKIPVGCVGTVARRDTLQRSVRRIGAGA